MANLEQLERALRAADAAGNEEDAKRLAQAYADARSQQQATPAQQPQAAQDQSYNPTDGMSGYEKFMAGMGKSFVDTGRGLAQVGSAAADAIPGVDLGDYRAGLQQRIDQARDLDAPLMGTKAGLAGNIAGYGSQILLPAAGLRTVPGAAKALLPTTMAGNAAQGAVLGGLQPVAQGESRLANLALGGTFGAGGSALAKLVGNVGRGAKEAVAPHVREVFEAAKARGINLSPAQLSDSRFMRYAQSWLRNVPFTGAQGRYQKQVADFNRQLASTVGEDAPILNSQVYGEAKRRQSDQFNQLTERNAMTVNDSLIRNLSSIADQAKMAGSQVSDQVESAIESLYAQAATGPNGVVIPGAAYQAFDSQLNSIIKSGGTPAHFLGNVQSVVRKAMDDSISPEDAAAWRQLRTEYGNRKTLAPLVAKASDGPISPSQVMGAVTNSRTSKEAMASGKRGQLGELAKIGQAMKEPPSSGSAERGFAAALLGGGAMIDPVSGGLTALSLNLLSRGMDSKLLARYMMRQNPGMTAEAAEQIIKRSANPVGQNRLADRAPLEIDVVGGTRVSPEQLSRELRALGL